MTRKQIGKALIVAATGGMAGEVVKRTLELMWKMDASSPMFYGIGIAVTLTVIVYIYSQFPDITDVW